MGIPPLLQFALGCELLLFVCERLFPGLRGFLPLGGSREMETVILVFIAIGLMEIINAIGGRPPRR
jgi:hypothetical protein